MGLQVSKTAFPTLQNQQFSSKNVNLNIENYKNYSFEDFENYSDVETKIGDNNENVNVNSDNISAISVGADVLMEVGGFINGFGNVAEEIIDFGALVGAATISTGTLVIDGASSLITGESLGLTDNVWNSTKAFVADKHVDTFFADFYTNNDIGISINNSANSTMQYGSIGYKGAETIGYVYGIGVATFATGGIGSAIGTCAKLTSTGTKIAEASSKILSNEKMVKTAKDAAVGYATGTSKGAGEAWESGADTFQGLLYANSLGAFQASQLGVSGLVSGKGTKAVVTNGVSGLLTIPVKTTFQSIYNDDSWGDRFGDNGGIFQSVLYAGIGAGFSNVFECGGAKSVINQMRNNYNAAKNGNEISIMKSSMDPRLNIVDGKKSSFSLGGIMIAHSANSFSYRRRIDKLSSNVNMNKIVKAESKTLLQTDDDNKKDKGEVSD